MKKKDQRSFFENGNLRLAGVIALTAVLLFVISIAGTVKNNSYVRSSLEASMEHSLESRVEAAVKQSEEESIEASVAASVEESIEASKVEETAVHEIELSDEEIQLLNLLKEHLDAGQMQEAAALLIEREEEFNSLFFGKLADVPCIYDGNTMVDQVSGHGLVFTRATTVFYGEFKDGKPEGSCLALQALQLEEGKRYDYAAGSWNNGKMNGTGECGYNYYEGVSDESAKETSKKGEFKDNTMEGSIVYTSRGSDDKEVTWTFEVSDGVIVQDDRWVQDTGEDGAIVYRLKADNQETHVYTVSESAMKEYRWKNLIEY